MDLFMTFRGARRRLRFVALGTLLAAGVIWLLSAHAGAAVAATAGSGTPVRMNDAPFSSSSVLLIIIALAVDSIAGVVFSVTSATVRQAATPDRLMGPVMALNYTLCGSMLAIGTFGGGFLGSRVGPSSAIFVGCVIYVLAGLSAIGKPLGSITMYRQPFLQTFERAYAAPHASRVGDPVVALPHARRTPSIAVEAGASARVCLRAGCHEEDVTACAYTDATGRECGTHWCAQHGADYGGDRVCQRHRRILEGLGLQTTDRADLPETDNWAVSLTLWIASAVDDDLRAALNSHFPASGGFQVRRLRTVSQHPPGGARSWAAPWTVVYKGSTVVTVVIWVGEDNDKLVVATVNAREAAREVPPWISTRRDAAAQSRLDEANRRRFYERLVARIAAVLP